MARTMDLKVQEPVTLVTVRGGHKPSKGKDPPSIPSWGEGSNCAALIGDSQHFFRQYPLAAR